MNPEGLSCCFSLALGGRGLPSASGRRNLSLFLDQFTEDDRDLFKFSSFIKEEICSGTQAFLTILGIRVVRANQNIEVWMVRANSTEHIETATSGHLQIENAGVWHHFLDAVYRSRHIACLSHKVRSGYLLLSRSARRSTITLESSAIKIFIFFFLENRRPMYRE